MEVLPVQGTRLSQGRRLNHSNSLTPNTPAEKTRHTRVAPQTPPHAGPLHRGGTSESETGATSVMGGCRTGVLIWSGRTGVVGLES